MTDAMPLETRLDRDAIRSIYDRLAPFYDLWADLTEVKARRAALEAAAIRDGERILEVAVGTGLAFEEVLRRNPGGWSEGIDLTPGMLRRAEARARRLGARSFRLSLGDATRLPHEDGAFDLVLNSYMFDLLPEAQFAVVLHEMHRVLRPGGRIVLVNMTAGERFWHRLAESVYRVSPRLMGGCRPVTLAPYVEAAGFRGVRRTIVTQLTFPSEILTAAKDQAAL
ncbi:MAG: methyltransferase domain-containing protein [Acidobacteriota bacterium]